jgi:hypothetical protein
METKLTIRPIVWEIKGYHRPGDPPEYEDYESPRIESRGPENDKPGARERFAVVYHGAFNLNRSTLEWDYERLPSSRTDKFFKTHRFYSVEEAMACFEKFARVEKKRHDKWQRAKRAIKHDPVNFL